MKSVFTILIAFVSTVSLAQTNPSDTTYWRKGGVTSLTFSQVSLTNWSAGGQNSVAINSSFSAFANRVKGHLFCPSAYVDQVDPEFDQPFEESAGDECLIDNCLNQD